MNLTKKRQREILSEFKKMISIIIDNFPDCSPENRFETIQACHRRQLTEKNDNLKQIYQALTVGLTKLHNSMNSEVSNAQN